MLTFLFAWSPDSGGFNTEKSIKCSSENKKTKDIKSNKDIVNIHPTEERVVTILIDYGLFGSKSTDPKICQYLLHV